MSNKKVRIAPRREFRTGISPLESNAGSKNWIMRGANFVVSYSDGEVDETYTTDVPDEHMVVTLDAEMLVDGAQESVAVTERTLAILPPGKNRTKITKAGTVIRIFSSAAKKIIAKSINCDDYAETNDEVAPLSYWPKPYEGWKIRVYKLSDFADRQYKIFRCTNLMINIVESTGPRDTRLLSPHSHSDFEQGSLLVKGDWIHELRYPWTADRSEWIDDEQLKIGSPSLTIIPPNVIHTSRATSHGPTEIIDIFSPPRLDFSEKNMVLNSADYPQSRRE